MKTHLIIRHKGHNSSSYYPHAQCQQILAFLVIFGVKTHKIIWSKIYFLGVFQVISSGSPGIPPPPPKKKKKYSPSYCACQIEQFLFFLPDNLKNTLDYLSKSHKSSLYYIYNFSQIWLFGNCLLQIASTTERFPRI